MPKVSFKEYQNIIRKGAWEKFANEWGIKGSILSLLLGIIAGIGWWVIFGGLDSLLIALAVFGFSVLCFMVFYIGFFDREHVFVYNKQKTEYEQLQASIDITPILSVKDYGNEHKPTYARFESTLVGDYDTLFIDIYNQQKRSVAERVWAQVEWIKGSTKVVLSHRGRWHIATGTIDNEPVRENLQYCDIHSNQSPQRLYFAWTYYDGRENSFHGLERDMDGRDSWGTSNYLLGDKSYKVRITLQGNNGVYQEFLYTVKNDNGKISIEKALTAESKKVTTMSKRKSS